MKALDEKELEAIEKYAYVDKENGIIALYCEEDTQQYVSIKHYLFTAKYKGWKVIEK